MDSLADMTLDDFNARIGEEFLIHATPDRAVSSVLTEAKSSGAGRPEDQSLVPGAGARRQFAILLRAPAEPPLEQSIYGIENATMGRFELFLVPVGQDAEGRYYEAVFT